MFCQLGISCIISNSFLRYFYSVIWFCFSFLPCHYEAVLPPSSAIDSGQINEPVSPGSFYFMEPARIMQNKKRGAECNPSFCLLVPENTNPGSPSEACCAMYGAAGGWPSPLSALPFHGSDRTSHQSLPASSPGMQCQKST
jgi:hypothetical protein